MSIEKKYLCLEREASATLNTYFKSVIILNAVWQKDNSMKIRWKRYSIIMLHARGFCKADFLDV